MLIRHSHREAPISIDIETYHVFLASPGDVQSERQQVRDFFDLWNRAEGNDYGVRLQVLDWENYSTAGIGPPQRRITSEVLDTYADTLILFIIIFGERFGTPTGRSGSGTEAEFRWALNKSKRIKSPLEVKLFFRASPTITLGAKPAILREAAEQLERVKVFKKKAEDGRNHYIKMFEAGDFARVLAEDLRLWLSHSDRPWSRRVIFERTSRIRLPFPHGAYSEPVYFVRNACQLDALDRTHRSTDSTTNDDGIDALNRLIEWALASNSPRFCTLLGGGGVGKTTVCQVLYKNLRVKCEEDPELPEPILLGLNSLDSRVKGGLCLEELLEVILAGTYPRGNRPGPRDVITRVRSGRAVAIFDGLDSILIHRTRAEGQQLQRTLWGILPKSPRGKLLISCRQNYLPTLGKEGTQLLGWDGDLLLDEDHLALRLLPFTDEQIAEYLRKRHPDQSRKDLLRSILSFMPKEIVATPYTLSLFADYVPGMQELLLKGERVNEASLYRRLVDNWLKRDQTGQGISLEEKRTLMELLAVRFWGPGGGAWSVKRVEQFLVDTLRKGRGRYSGRYPGRGRILDELLPFVVRVAADTARFAQVSLQEFFLASYLERGLRCGLVETLQIQNPTLKTLDFLGQLIQVSDLEKCLNTIRDLLFTCYTPEATELAFRYVLYAIERNYPSISLSGCRLDDSNLVNIEITSRGGGEIDLRGASFCGANLSCAKFYGIDMTGANFERADLSGVELIGGHARKSRFGSANLAGALFRDLELQGGQISLRHGAIERCGFIAGWGRRVDCRGRKFTHCVSLGHGTRS